MLCEEHARQWEAEHGPGAIVEVPMGAKPRRGLDGTDAIVFDNNAQKCEGSGKRDERPRGQEKTMQTLDDSILHRGLITLRDYAGGSQGMTRTELRAALGITNEEARMLKAELGKFAARGATATRVAWNAACETRLRQMEHGHLPTQKNTGTGKGRGKVGTSLKEGSEHSVGGSPKATKSSLTKARRGNRTPESSAAGKGKEGAKGEGTRAPEPAVPPEPSPSSAPYPVIALTGDHKTSILRHVQRTWLGLVACLYEARWSEAGADQEGVERAELPCLIEVPTGRLEELPSKFSRVQVVQVGGRDSEIEAAMIGEALGLPDRPIVPAPARVLPSEEEALRRVDAAVEMLKQRQAPALCPIGISYEDFYHTVSVALMRPSACTADQRSESRRANLFVAQEALRREIIDLQRRLVGRIGELCSLGPAVTDADRLDLRQQTIAISNLSEQREALLHIAGRPTPPTPPTGPGPSFKPEVAA